MFLSILLELTSITADGINCKNGDKDIHIYYTFLSIVFCDSAESVLPNLRVKLSFVNVFIYILNKSENATPELFAIYIQNNASQESK